MSVTEVVVVNNSNLRGPLIPVWVPPSTMGFALSGSPFVTSTNWRAIPYPGTEPQRRWGSLLPAPPRPPPLFFPPTSRSPPHV
ncbi:hypothetical protein Taro_047590 [Colocasia esculenta]|uniref:Uncharacterized protein n=1 Tax=Colocasia esculenta TaxID=4460 RepID=A0A843X6T3_COLES|nr:hypothetical protein [Colocasia esculenta]